MTRVVGNFIIYEPEGDGQCELCGVISDLRPYGPNGERICVDCGDKNPEATQRMMDARLNSLIEDARNPGRRN